MNVIRQLIDENKLSQKSFGASLGVSQSMVGQWLRGDRKVSPEKAIAIERLYGIPASLLSDRVNKIRSGDSDATLRAE